MHAMYGIVLMDGKPQGTGPMSFSKEAYEYFATHSPKYVLGYRLIKEYYVASCYAAVYVEIKPKIRYKAIRYAVEYELHLWTTENALDPFESTGPIGTYEIWLLND